MNPKNTLLGMGIALLMITPGLRADTSAYAAIVKERDTVLSKIVAGVESRHLSGMVDDDAVWAAKLALLSFRRDASATASGKLEQQEQIVALEEKKLSTLKARFQAGTTDSLDVLRATDALLAAKQLRAEIQSDGKKG